MATVTKYYGFKKPDYIDSADISVINENMDAIDTKMKEIENKAISGGGSGSSVSYSTEEQVVGTWIDGKPLYQKTVEFALPAAGFSNVVYEFADFDKCIEMHGFCQIDTHTFIDIVGWLGYFVDNASSSEYFASLIKNSKLLVSVSKPLGAYAGSPCYCTVKYTKTTD